jgi:hypothetical protein
MAAIDWDTVVLVAAELASAPEDLQDLILGVANTSLDADLFGGEDSDQIMLARALYAAHMATELGGNGAGGGGGATSGPVEEEEVTKTSVRLRYATAQRLGNAAGSIAEMLMATSYGRRLIILIRASGARVAVPC